MFNKSPNPKYDFVYNIQQEKAEQWTESAKQTAQSARDKTAEVAQSAHDKAIDVTHSAQNKSADKSHPTRESAQHGQEQTAGFLGQVYFHLFYCMYPFEVKFTSL